MGADPERRRVADRLWRVLRLTTAAIVVVSSVWMVWTLARDERLPGLADRAIVVRDVVAAAVMCGLSQMLYFARWPWLLRVLRVPLGWLESMTAAATSQLLGSLAFGAAAGDIYRAIASGPRCAGHRVGLLASILADRVAGLYSLICLGALAATIPIGATPQWTTLRTASLPVLWAAVVGGGICIALGLFVDLGPALAFVRRWPAVHALVARVLSSLERFRGAPLAFLAAVGAGIVVHALNGIGLWLMARGLSLPHPSPVQHCQIISFMGLTGLLPLPLAGLGAVEVLVDQLYAAAVPEARGAGMIATLTFRIVSLASNAVLVAGLLAAARGRPAVDGPPGGVS